MVDAYGASLPNLKEENYDALVLDGCLGGLWRYIWRLDDDLDALLYRFIELEELVLIGHLETW